MPVLIETPRLTIEPLALDRDEPFLFQLLNEPGYLQNIADRNITDLAAARAYLETGPLLSYATHGHGLWRVTERSTGAPVGMCGLLRRDALDAPDVGYAFLATASGQGYATEAAAACVAYGRGALGMDRIVAVTSPANQGSIRVLTKLGMRVEKTIQFTDRGGALLFVF
jgi:RimJ/RimL family protein N-acetyltransferase